jgi:hypothetical protein
MTSLHIVDYAPFIRAQRDALQARRQEARLAWGSLKRKGDVDASSAIVAAAGDRRLAKLREVLDNFEGFVRSNGQRRFHEEFIKASLPHIYLSEFETHRDRILRENKMDRVRFEILVCTPRRFGKTTSVSMFCAALLATCPDMWISVFSTGQRASSALLDQTAKFFRMLTEDAYCLGGDERILKKNQEQLFTRGRTPEDVRRMFSYPSTVSGLKGVGGRILILEEVRSAHCTGGFVFLASLAGGVAFAHTPCFRFTSARITPRHTPVRRRKSTSRSSARSFCRSRRCRTPS